MGRIVEILLEEINLIETGNKLAPGKNFLIMELIAPRSGEPSIVRTIELPEIRENETVDFITNPYRNRICFKEEVIGTFGLSIKVTSMESTHLMMKLLEKAYKAVLPGGTSYLAGGLGSALLNKPIEAISSGRIDEIMIDEERTYIIGESYADFESSKMPDLDHWNFSLIPKKQVLIKQMVPIFNGHADGNAGSRIVREMKTFAELDANNYNGHIKFEVHIY